MGYTIQWAPRALRDLKSLDHSIQKRVSKHIDSLQTDPRSAGCKKMEGMDGVYRLRIGDYRIIYQIKDSMLLVLVLKIGHRRDIYR